MAKASPLSLNNILPAILVAALVVLLVTRSKAGRDGFQDVTPSTYDIYGVLVTTTPTIIDRGFLNVPGFRMAYGIDQNIGLQKDVLALSDFSRIFTAVKNAKGTTGRYVLIDAENPLTSYDEAVTVYTPLLTAAGISGTPVPVKMVISAGAEFGGFTVVSKDGSTLKKVIPASIPESEKVKITGASITGTLENVVKLFTVLKDQPPTAGGGVVNSIITNNGATLYTKASGYAAGVQSKLASYGESTYIIVFEKPIVITTYELFYQYMGLSAIFKPSSGAPSFTPIETGTQFVDLTTDLPVATSSNSSSSSTMMYIGIGVGVLAVGGIAIWAMSSSSSAQPAKASYSGMGGRRR
jgi:hypothetical protein